MSLTKVTYSMIDSAPINVKDFGAVGDGVVDDTAAIQAAIDSALRLGYDATANQPESTYSSQVVYFPAGEYLVSSIIVDRSGIRLVGAGRSNSVIVGSSTTANTVVIGGSTTDATYNQGVQDLHIGQAEGVDKTAGANLLLSNVRNTDVRNLYLSDVWQGYSQIGGYKVFIENVLIQGRYGRTANGDFGFGFQYNETVGVQQPKISDTRLVNSMVGTIVNTGVYVDSCDWLVLDLVHANIAQETSLLIDAKYQVASMRVDQCYFDSARDRNLDITGSAEIQDLYFANTVFSSFTFEAETLQNVRMGTSRTGPSRNIVFTDCYMDRVFGQNVLMNPTTKPDQVKFISSNFTKRSGSNDTQHVFCLAASTYFVGNTIVGGTAAFTNTAVDFSNSDVVIANDNDFTECDTPEKLSYKPSFVSRGNINADVNIQILDDAFIAFDPHRDSGVLAISTTSTGTSALVQYRTSDSAGGALCEKLTTNTTIDSVDVTTGDLTGTTGVDGKLTVSAGTDGRIYVENRKGFTLTLTTSNVVG